MQIAMRFASSGQEMREIMEGKLSVHVVLSINLSNEEKKHTHTQTLCSIFNPFFLPGSPLPLSGCGVNTHTDLETSSHKQEQSGSGFDHSLL